MPFPGETYSVTDDWRRAVLAELEPTDKRAKRSKAWLALEVTNLVKQAARHDAKLAEYLVDVEEVSRGVINDLLNVEGKRKALRSPLVLWVNKAVGFPPPATETFSDEEIALVMLYRTLDDEGRKGVRNDIARRKNERVGRVGSRLETAVDVAKTDTPEKSKKRGRESSDRARTLHK